MLPMSLDIARVPVVLVGRGDAVARRLVLLDEAGATALAVFCDQPSAELARRAGDRLRRRLPNEDDFARAGLVMVAGLPATVSAAVVAAASTSGALLNVEDSPGLCDIHMPAIVRRGALTLAISTAGRSPGLARVLKRALEPLIDARWGRWLDELASDRARWRAAGHSMAEVSRRTAAVVRGRGWLARLEGRRSASRDRARGQPEAMRGDRAGAAEPHAVAEPVLDAMLERLAQRPQAKRLADDETVQ
jgi:precorrin-2 dehydrogenase/sirohydrochlorin ferrochelatase